MPHPSPARAAEFQRVHAQVFPSTKAVAQRLGLVTIAQMIDALSRPWSRRRRQGSSTSSDVPAIRRASPSTEVLNV